MDQYLEFMFKTAMEIFWSVFEDLVYTPDSQKVLNGPRILKLTLIMFLNIEKQNLYLNVFLFRKQDINHL